MKAFEGEKYPKFLKRSPQVWGFDFYDLAVIAFCLFIATIFFLPSWGALILSSIGIFISKVLRHYIDFTVLFLERVKRWGEF